MLYANGVRGLVFDHNPPSRYLTQALLDAAREAGIPTVAVPHGTHMLVNELRATSREQTGRFGRIEILEPYDHVVAMEPMIANYFMRMGLPAAQGHRAWQRALLSAVASRAGSDRSAAGPAARRQPASTATRVHGQAGS